MALGKRDEACVALEEILWVVPSVLHMLPGAILNHNKQVPHTTPVSSEIHLNQCNLHFHFEKHKGKQKEDNRHPFSQGGKEGEQAHDVWAMQQSCWQSDLQTVYIKMCCSSAQFPSHAALPFPPIMFLGEGNTLI